MELKNLEEEKPLAYKTGEWDGKMSDLCLCVDEKGEYHLANFYEYDDGQFEWYDKEEYGLKYEIVKWIELPN